jgi:hypothetical protein
MIFFVCPLSQAFVGSMSEALLRQVPLFPCLLDGNAISTIPYKYTVRQKQAFEFGCADGQDRQGPASRRVSHVYEINTNFRQAPVSPSLKLEAFLSQKQKGSAGSPGLKHPGALGRHGRPGFQMLVDSVLPD